MMPGWRRSGVRFVGEILRRTLNDGYMRQVLCRPLRVGRRILRGASRWFGGTVSLAAMIEVANAIVFLCSDEASFITGHALVVGGGLSIQLREDLSVRLGRYVREHPETWLSD